MSVSLVSMESRVETSSAFESVSRVEPSVSHPASTATNDPWETFCGMSDAELDERDALLSGIAATYGAGGP